MGIKERNSRPLHEDLSLEDLDPKDNFYRRLGERLDFSFARELVLPLYALGGRSSVEPVVFFKLQFVMHFEDLRSERQLVEVALRNLERPTLHLDRCERRTSRRPVARHRDVFQQAAGKQCGS